MQRFGPLIVAIVLTVTGLTLLWVLPPDSGVSAGQVSSTRPARSEADVSAMPAWPDPGAGELTVTSSGDGAPLGLAYRFEDGDEFQLIVEQQMTLTDSSGDTEVVTRMTSSVVVEDSEAGEDVIFISFDDFDIDIKADGEPVDIPGVSTLLKGIKVQLSWDPRRAIVEETPVSVGNPQVKRMLSLLVDAFRQAHAPLPDDELAAGAEWKQRSEYDQNGLASHSASKYVLNQDSRETTVTRTGTLSVDGELDGDTMSGTGKTSLTAVFDGPRFVSSTGTADVVQTLNDGEASQELRMNWSLARD